MVNLHKMVVKHTGKNGAATRPGPKRPDYSKTTYIMNQGEAPAQQLGDGGQPKSDLGSRVGIHITLESKSLCV
jgi:hypothetical protein